MERRITIPPKTRELLSRLSSAGFAAYAVGGCVRDSLLGQTPQDWDICTSARPEEILACFPAERTILTGVRFGEDEIGVVAADTEGTWACLRTPYADTYFHGGGDTFASALCAGMVADKPFLTAARDALDFTYRSIRRTVPTDTRYGLCFEPELKTL